ncbi:hypothetical protein LN040_03270 [Desulfovibrio subterraneus]|nr:hypothetical protein [Desulfovibrio subterraneus]WBF68140.1 hypothetical protein LN040_03270 [Desulfovibrio subterraneus]
MTFDRSTMWDAITALATVSHSYASNNQRMLSKVFKNLNSLGLASPQMPQTVSIHPTIEATTGKVISKIT